MASKRYYGYGSYGRASNPYRTIHRASSGSGCLFTLIGCMLSGVMLVILAIKCKRIIPGQ